MREDNQDVGLIVDTLATSSSESVCMLQFIVGSFPGARDPNPSKPS